MPPMYKGNTSEQVDAFLVRLAPTPRLRLREAMGKLRTEGGDIRVLEGDLSGFYRLKRGRYRVIFCYAEPRTIGCIFAEERKLVYEIFSALLRE